MSIRASASKSAAPAPPELSSAEQEAVTAAVYRLQSAASSRIGCDPVRDLIGSSDIRLAYAVQQALTADRVRAGARIVGRKAGLTSPAVQRQLGVDQPDFGVLFEDMICPEGDPIDMLRLMQPRVEAEVAFVLGADLAGPLEDLPAIRSAVDFAVPALEIVDSRIRGWDIQITDTVADNASGGVYVLGADRIPLAGLDTASIEMTLTCDGEVASTGTGRDCLGDPLFALAWLARTCQEYGAPLLAGDIVLSGALGPVVDIKPGTHVSATLTQLGPVTAVFSKESSG